MHSAFAILSGRRVISSKSLYRRLGSSVIVLFVLWGSIAVRSQGQAERPQILPQKNKPQENKKPKNGKEPRAVGVLQLSSGGKATLVPVAILIDGRFYDASAYKADPIPMALESGTVYEAEQSGDAQGLFTVNAALHSKNSAGEHPWVGTGTYLPQGAEALKTTRKAEDVPVGLDSSGDAPPRLTRKDGSKPAGSPDSGSAGSPASGTGQKPSGTDPASSKPANGSPSGPASGPDAAKGGDKPTPEKPVDASGKQPAPAGQTASDKESKPSSAGDTAAGQSSGDFYRPQLRRGKPTEAAPPDDDAKGARQKGGDAGSVATASAANPGPVQMVAAVSDAAGPEPQSYKFFWKNGEEEERRNQMLAAAADEVRAYATALAKNKIVARPIVPKASAASHKAQAKQAQPVFENVQFRGFDVWLTNQPVMILSAEAHIPPAPGAAGEATDSYSVTLVARTDIYGNLRKLYSGVTDKFHLDVTPRMELIDVVDADGDRRGELLFRETTDAGSGYLIYRATADKLWKMFDSLNAE